MELKSKYTIAIVTHNMQQAARVSDFTAFFYRGHILDFGATGDIFNKYSLLEDIPRKEHLDALLKFDRSHRALFIMRRPSVQMIFPDTASPWD